MAQHDMNIANQSFPDFRTDLNNALSALNTMHSGTSRPSGAAAGTLWLDTTNSGSNSLIVKFFDGSDDITFATINTSSNTVDFSDSSTDTVTFKQEGTNFTGSLLLGHATSGTLSTAIRNTGVGIVSLDALTEGDNNTAVGYNSATSLTTGSSNTAIGSTALVTSTNSSNNTAIGLNALRDATSGSNNTAVGSQAGLVMSGGSAAYNTLIGVQAGDNISSGAGNVVIGSVDVDTATGDRQLKIAGNDGSTTTTWISGSSSGVVTFNAANVTQQALTSSSNAVAWDASAKPNAVHVTTENTTFAAPTNNVEGAFIALEINYNGSHTIAFNTVFEFAGSTAPTFTSTDGKTDILVFRYNGAVWQEVGRTLNLSES
jgi:hypothetical protein